MAADLTNTILIVVALIGWSAWPGHRAQLLRITRERDEARKQRDSAQNASVVLSERFSAALREAYEQGRYDREMEFGPRSCGFDVEGE